PYLENPKQTEDHTIPFFGKGLLTAQFGEMALSPNAKHLAYIDQYFGLPNNTPVKRILRVIDSSGHSYDMNFWKEDWQWIFSWVDDRHLAIVTAKKQIMILNPFTGETKTFPQPDWLSTLEPYWGFAPNFSPTLDFVLLDSEYDARSLMDTQTGKTVWKTDHD